MVFYQTALSFSVRRNPMKSKNRLLRFMDLQFWYRIFIGCWDSINQKKMHSMQYLIYILVIKMSEAEVDRIIAKYERKSPYHIPETQLTQRKPQKKDRHVTFMMDQSTTPNKQEREEPLLEKESKSMLKCLDQAEAKLAKSQRNYAQVCRKYERSKQICEELSTELEKQRKGRLQELIDFQNRLHLLENDNSKGKTVMEAKDHTIAVLRQKLRQKEEQTKLFEQQLEQISHKVATTIQLKEQQSVSFLQRQISINHEEASRSMAIVKQKYEEQVASLKKQVAKFDQIILQKEKEKRELLDDMEQLTKNHNLELKMLRQTIAKNEDEYRKWLDQAKQEKLDLVEKYEHNLREIRRNAFNDRIKETSGNTEELVKEKMLSREMEECVTKLQEQIKNYKIEVSTLARADEQSTNRISQLEQELRSLKIQLAQQTIEARNFMKKLKQQQGYAQSERRKSIKIESSMQQMKRKCQEMRNQNIDLIRQNTSLKDTMSKQLKSLVSVKKELSEATDNQLNINSTLTQTTLQMKKKIKELEQQLESITTQLYAERLEKVKLQQEIEETKVELKREYELSMQNTRKELEEQIKRSYQEEHSGGLDPEKERLYLQMFQMQRKYELMKSQVITTEEMLRMGTKMTKYYAKKVK